MYVSIMHPAVKDADYYIPIIINEAFMDGTGFGTAAGRVA